MINFQKKPIIILVILIIFLSLSLFIFSLLLNNNQKQTNRNIIKPLTIITLPPILSPTPTPNRLFFPGPNEITPLSGLIIDVIID